MKESHVLAFVGEKRAGKGTAADIYRKISYSHHNLPISRHTFSDVVREILQKRDIPFGRKTAQDLVMELINENASNDTLSKIVEERIWADPNSHIILDGIRLWPDYHMICRFPSYHLVYVTAPARIRHRRALLDSDKVDEINISFEEFCEKEKHQLELDIPIIGANVADFFINNIGTRAELERKVIELREKIKF